MGVWLGKAIVFSVIFTIFVLLILALLMFKADLSLETTEKLMLVCYIGAPFLGAFYLGKKVVQKRFLWGLLVGICYFGVFLLLGLGLGEMDIVDWVAELRIFFMSILGGLLGGMIS